MALCMRPSTFASAGPLVHAVFSPDHHVGSESAIYSSNTSRQDELIVGERDLRELRLGQGVVADATNVREIRSGLRQGHVLRECLFAVLHPLDSHVALEALETSKQLCRPSSSRELVSRRGICFQPY